MKRTPRKSPKRKKGTRRKSTRLAQKLKKIREQLGFSQNELLEQLGFADELFRSNISQYERGDRIPAPSVLLAYARLANVDLAILIDDDLDFAGSTASKRGKLQKKKRLHSS